MEQYKCIHCGVRKNETETVITTKFRAGKKIMQRVCTKCYSRTMPNPLKKKIQLQWIIITCLTGLLAYLLAYKVF